jgi:hypothetical protein
MDETNAAPEKHGVAFCFLVSGPGQAFFAPRGEPSAALLRLVRLPRTEEMKTFQQALHSQGKRPSLNMTTFCIKPFRSVREVRSEPQYLQCGDGMEAFMRRAVSSLLSWYFYRHNNRNVDGNLMIRRYQTGLGSKMGCGFAVCRS